MAMNNMWRLFQYFILKFPVTLQSRRTSEGLPGKISIMCTTLKTKLSTLFSEGYSKDTGAIKKLQKYM